MRSPRPCVCQRTDCRRSASCNGYESISVQGHTDRLGSTRYNQDLSTRRAESVKTYLVDRVKLDPARIVAARRAVLANKRQTFSGERSPSMTSHIHDLRDLFDPLGLSSDDRAIDHFA